MSRKGATAERIKGPVTASRRVGSLAPAPMPLLSRTTVPWPQFQKIDDALTEYPAHVSDKAIRQAAGEDRSNAADVPEPAKIG